MTTRSTILCVLSSAMTLVIVIGTSLACLAFSVPVFAAELIGHKLTIKDAVGSPAEGANIRGGLDVNNDRITNVGDPTATTDAANKRYVDTREDAILESTVFGAGANAQSSGGIAIGNNAVAVQSGSVAVGKGAKADSSVAVGTGAQATGTNTTAVGDNAVASGNSAAAFGNNAQATHDNSVAIGNGSSTSAVNTVSVGSAGSERRITNVATPTNSTDAANKQYVDDQIAHTDRRVGLLRKDAFRGIAQAAAIMPLAPGQAGETTVNVGLGAYGGEYAGGLAVSHQLGEQLNVNAGVGFSSGNKNVVRVGLGFRF